MPSYTTVSAGYVTPYEHRVGIGTITNSTGKQKVLEVCAEYLNFAQSDSSLGEIWRR